MTIPTPLTIAQLKKAKNAVIGNPSNKRQMASDTKFIHQLVECIASQQPDNVRLEAAHVLASLSYGSQEALASLLQADAHRVLVYTLSRLHNQASLQNALARVLRTIAVAVADVVGPSQAGLTPHNPPSRHLAVEALDFLFHNETLDVYLPLLSPSTTPASLGTATSICHLLGAAVRDSAQRRVVTDWTPPSQRHIHIPHRVHRGWEREGGEVGRSWVTKALLEMISSHDQKAQEAGLLALSALSQDNSNLAIALTKNLGDAPSPLPTILALAKSRSPDMQLSACACVTSIIRALPATSLHASLNYAPTSPLSVSPSNHHSLHSLLSTSPNAHHGPAVPDGETCARTVMSIINTFLDHGDNYYAGQQEATDTQVLAGRQQKTRACFILYHLVSDDAVLCEAAHERSCLPRLVKIIQNITAVPPPESEEKRGIDDTPTVQEEPASISALREACMTVIAAIGLFDNDIRRFLTMDSSMLSLHSAVLSSLKHHHAGVRYAACQYVRAVGRAVAVLRTSMIDSGLATGVWDVLKKELEAETLNATEDVEEKSLTKQSPMDMDAGDLLDADGGEDGGVAKAEDLGGDRRVMNAALMAICNLVNDFSPMRQTLLDDGLIAKLATIVDIDEPSLRLNAVWTLKNTLYKTTTDQKRRVMASLGWTKLISLLGDSDPSIQEQAFNVGRNLVEDEEGIDLVFSEIGSDVLLDTLVSGLNSSYEDVVLQAAYLLGNLTNGANSHHTQLLTHPRILPALLSCLTHWTKTEIRRPIVTCIVQLARHSRHQTSPVARNAMRRIGFEDALTHICEWGSSGAGPAPVSSSPSHPIILPGIRTGLSVSLGTAGISAGGRGIGASLESDRDVVNQARMALHLLDYVE